MKEYQILEVYCERNGSEEKDKKEAFSGLEWEM